MDLTYAGYLLFVLPGFFMLWTYRHFAKATKIGEFEYAAWSFFWGVPIFLLFFWILSLNKTTWPSVPLNNPGAELGSLVALSLLITIGSFALGFIGAIISQTGLFDAIDNRLFESLKKYKSMFKKMGKAVAPSSRGIDNKK